LSDQLPCYGNLNTFAVYWIFRQSCPRCDDLKSIHRQGTDADTHQHANQHFARLIVQQIRKMHRIPDAFHGGGIIALRMLIQRRIAQIVRQSSAVIQVHHWIFGFVRGPVGMVEGSRLMCQRSRFCISRESRFLCVQPLL